jgi:adenine/guanine phosphoribosyltransferase-like PRPP-binding protein
VRPAQRRKAAPRRAAAYDDQPLGAGVADAFAVRRLMKAQPPSRRERGVREIGWAEFGALAAALADRIGARYQPDVVLGIMNAGVFVGGALAPALRAELVHLHLPGRGEGRLPSLAGKRVLVVDDAAGSGRTLARAVALAKKARAAEVRTAVVVLRPGGAKPDWHALASEDLAVFGWDYQFHGGEGSEDPGDTGV